MFSIVRWLVAAQQMRYTSTSVGQHARHTYTFPWSGSRRPGMLELVVARAGNELLLLPLQRHSAQLRRVLPVSSVIYSSLQHRLLCRKWGLVPSSLFSSTNKPTLWSYHLSSDAWWVGLWNLKNVGLGRTGTLTLVLPKAFQSDIM